MTLIKEILFTLTLVASMLVMCAVIMVVAVFFESPGTGVAAILIGIFAFTYHSGRWFAYRTPHAKDLHRFRWTSNDGDKMESCVENAAVFSGHIETTIIRVSIYNRTRKKRAKRRLIGDNAEYLRKKGEGFWFLIHDRFHARKDGLVCVDRKTGEVLFHQPKKQIDMDDEDAVQEAFEAAKKQLASRPQM